MVSDEAKENPDPYNNINVMYDPSKETGVYVDEI